VAPVARRLLGVDAADAVEALPGLRFPNRFGVAAGLDKNAVALNGWAALGFGHVEVGTVTPLAQPGNPPPRLFRLPAERALINRLGFPNDGAPVVARRLARRPPDLPLVVGANIGKGKETPLAAAVDDYRRAAGVLAPYVDFFTVNVSSPNTPGLRDLQAPERLAAIVSELRGSTYAPVLVKLAPDLEWDALPDLVAAARQAGAAGLVAANTTIQRPGVLRTSAAASEPGGLSGAPLRAQAVRLTARLAELAGHDLAVVSVGGIFSAADVRERLAAGARLVQLYTGLVYAGPGLVAGLLADLRQSQSKSTSA
jgi:dihydroorotate dehydrogenase